MSTPCSLKLNVVDTSEGYEGRVLLFTKSSSSVLGNHEAIIESSQFLFDQERRQAGPFHCKRQKTVAKEEDVSAV